MYECNIRNYLRMSSKNSWSREKEKEREGEHQRHSEDIFYKKGPKSYNHLVLQYHIMSREREKRQSAEETDSEMR